MDETSLTDEALVEQIKQGNIELFEEIVARYQRKLVNYIYRMINDYDSAMELCQEVFIKVFSSLDKYNPEYKFTTWIHRISSNATIDWMRKKKLDTYSIEGQDDDSPGLRAQLEAGGLSPLQDLEMNQLQGRIEQAIAELPFIYRQLIILRHLNELSYDEIASAVELPLGTVKNRIFRGREILKGKLSEDMSRKGGSKRG
ncbi:RNA polymerase sigma factor [Acanthopleuribacter pedis]|uniref:Sigma-70 family RNA polymerase sigma factor n=1 Tax=Acanthopleuribacter pedis TaxID=442870 RepID=A0A8J7U684_9BACT|nr:sigma-70 family RNA polymerase sigma factor [Acanthopleuribacter pedis]MBO1320106.1 sigma-70 family RNA polymerase sigma factor [Acanthopleuribacter pedis]